jgi:beta-N-acetylglucosaminidase
MKTLFKNIVLISTVVLTPLKSSNNTTAVKNVQKYIPETYDLVKLTEKRNPKNYDFLKIPMEKYKEHERLRALNLIKMPKPQKDLDVSKTKFTGHPEFLNMFLKGVLEGKGEQFIKAQETHGINASFLVGIAKLESANGLSDFARNRNNIAGMRNSKGYMYFDSVDECIDKMAKNLKENYIDQGLTTLSQINKKYAENQEWHKSVIDHMNPMYQASKCKVYYFEK